MKTNPDFRFFLIAFGLILGLGSCTSDEAPDNENSLKLDGQSFSVLFASIQGVAINGEGHAGITLGSTNGTSTKTLTIDFEYAGDSDVEGSYAYPLTSGTMLLNDFLTNYVEFEGTSTTSFSLLEGTTSVINNGGNNYTVIIDLTMEGGKTFSGTYTGDFVVGFNNGQ